MNESVSNGRSNWFGHDDTSIAGACMVLAGVIVFVGIITAEVLYPDYLTRQDISDLGSTQPPDVECRQYSATRNLCIQQALSDITTVCQYCRAEYRARIS